MMNKYIFFTLILMMLLYVTDLNAQNLMTKTVQLNDPAGNPASSVTLYVMDGFSCQEYATNNFGIAKIEVQKETFVIYAADLSGSNRYGVSAYSPNYSGPSHSFNIPYFPRNQRHAGAQIEVMFDNLRKAFDFASIADLFIAIRNGTHPIIPSQLGVPTVFSINPIPKKMDDGTNRLGIEISGILVDPIIDFANRLPGSQYLPGRQYVYGQRGAF